MVSYGKATARSIWASPVLILIVMDNGLLLGVTLRYSSGERVLILIVMDNGLLLHYT